MDAVRLLTDDHLRLQALLSAFERAASDAERREIAALVGVELSIHAAVEREIFTPALAHAASFREHAEENTEEAAGAGSEREHAAVESLLHRLGDTLAAGAPYAAEFARVRCLMLAHCREQDVRLQLTRHRLGEQLERIGWLLTTRRAQLVAERGPATP
jgi:hypothetical protein